MIESAKSILLESEKLDASDNDTRDTSSEEDQSRYDAIEAELRNLSDWHRMSERCGVKDTDSGCSIKKKPGRTRTLKPMHLEDFSDDDYSEAFRKGNHEQKDDHSQSESFRRFRIFNQFARSVCYMSAIKRKEIFEAWAMALYVHETFLSTKAMARRRRKIPIKRFAELVCSHGLLSWALLLLVSADEEEEEEEGEANNTQDPQQRSMTAVCVDIAMPKSSETAAGIFFEKFPQFVENTPEQQFKDARWDYVEGPVENLVPHESTLLVGIHACGRLSDTIVAQAITSNAPLALVPCCHSKKILTPEQKKDFAIYAASQCVPATKANLPNAPATYSIADTLADFQDSIRIQRLVNAGYDVREVWIPQEFTLKNRIILAIPPTTATEAADEVSNTLKTPKRSNKWGIPYFPIPLEDAPKARAVIRSISGRGPAVERYNSAHPPPAISISVWIPNPTDEIQDRTGEEKQEHCGEEFTVESLQRVLDENPLEGDSAGTQGVKVVNATHKYYRNPEDGRIAKTFRVHYLDCRNNKTKAHKLHKTLKEITIPMHFPSVTVR